MKASKELRLQNAQNSGVKIEEAENSQQITLRFKPQMHYAPKTQGCSGIGQKSLI